MSEGLAYFLDKKVGGNPVTIALAHTIDYVHRVVGEYASSHVQTQIQRPNQSIIDAKTGEKRPTTSNVPDLVSVHGTLKPSDYVAEGATLIGNFRSGAPFPGTIPFVWTITGEKGRLQISNERGPYIQAVAAGFPTPIELEEFETGEVKSIEWVWEDWQEPLLPSGKCIGKLYDVWYEGRTAEFGVHDFDSAVERHRWLDSFLY